MKMTWVAGLVVLTGAAFGFSGCGGASISDACQYACDCTKNCTPKQEADCESQLAGTQTLADKADCTSEFNDAVSCSGDATCKDAELQISDCAAEVDALNKCLHDSGFGGGTSVSGSGGSTPAGGSDTCNQAEQHEAQCLNMSPTNVPDAQCTGTLLCESKCILAASCDTFNGKDAQGAQTFESCVNACK